MSDELPPIPGSNTVTTPVPEQPPATPDPLAAVTAEIATLKAELETERANVAAGESHASAIQSELYSEKKAGAVLAADNAELKAKMSTMRPAPVLRLPSGPTLSEDPAIQSTQLSALVNQEMARLQALQQPGRLLTVSDVLSGPLHP